MVFSINRINYVMAGDTKNLVNVELSVAGKANSLSHNVSYFADMPNTSIDVPISGEIRTHYIRKLEGDNVSSEANTTDRPFHGNVIYDLFDAKDLVYGSDIPAHTIRDEDLNDGHVRIDKSREMIDIYSPKFDGFVGFVQIGGNSILAMSNPTSEAFNLMHTTQRDDRQHRLSNDSGKMFWNYKLSSGYSDTFSYAPLSDLRFNSYDYGQEGYDPNSEDYMVHLSSGGYYGWAISYEQLSANRISSIFDNKFNMVDLPINYMFEIQSMAGSDRSKSYPDFNHGVIGSQMYLGKNQYDSMYAMEMPKQTEIRHIREYVGLGTTGGTKPFLKYYDDRNFRMRDRRPDESKEFPLPSLSCDETQTMEMVPLPPDMEGMRPYQSVEILDSNNRGINTSKHKSNLYSVDLKQTFINSASIQDPKLLEQIKTDIRNTVRKIAERLQPAHTQLFQVYFSESEGTRGGFFETERKLEGIKLSRSGQKEEEGKAESHEQ